MVLMRLAKPTQFVRVLARLGFHTAVSEREEHVVRTILELQLLHDRIELRLRLSCFGFGRVESFTRSFCFYIESYDELSGHHS